MALTLTEAAKLSNDIVLQGVIHTVVKESPLLARMPFMDVNGNAITYNRENAAAAAAFFDVGDTWTEGVATYTQVTRALKILGGDADVDRYIATTRSNVQDQEAAVIELKSKAVAHKAEDTLLNGDDSVDTKSFDGLKLEVTGGQTATMGTNGATLTLAKVEELIDLVKLGRPDLLVMSRRTRRTLTSLVRASGAFMETRQNEFGQFQEFYAGIPIAVTDFQSDAETQGSSSVASSMYAIRFGEDGVMGIQGAGGLQVEEVGMLETKDARRWRIKWYLALAVFSDLALAKLNGILV